MKFLKFLIIIALAFVLGEGVAQEYAFKVLINKGQNTIKAGNTWLPIKVGISLKSTDELKISQNGYLGLVHVSGKPLEVKNAGNQKVHDLMASIKPGPSVLHQYTDFILSTSKEKRNNLTATGAVHRGPDRIKVFLPKAEHAMVFNDNICITWGQDPKTPVYIVSFNSMFGDQLDKVETRDTILSVDLKGVKFANEENILIEVSSKVDAKKKSEQFMIKKLSAADKGRINSSLKEVATLNAEQTALNQLYLANFYEKHSLLIDASTAYQKAIRLAADVPYFQQAYAGFLVRNGLIRMDR